MRTRPPVPVCRGTSPNQAANSRPDRKAAGSPIAATAAVALSTPTPGIAAIRRQPLRDPREGRRHVPPHPGAASRHHVAVFGQQTPQAVDLRRAELHQLLAHPMQRQHRLLRFALDCHRLDAGLLNRHPDRPRVVRIVLVAADERPHHLRRQQADLVAQRPEPPRPVLRAPACLHADQTRRPIREMLQELRSTRPDCSCHGGHRIRLSECVHEFGSRPTP